MVLRGGGGVGSTDGGANVEVVTDNILNMPCFSFHLLKEVQLLSRTDQATDGWTDRPILQGQSYKAN